MFLEEPDEEDWRSLIKEKVEKLEHGGSVKDLKDCTLIEGELFKRGNCIRGCLEISCQDVSVRRKENRI